jgi:anti-sigma B factor antagonist
MSVFQSKAEIEVRKGPNGNCIIDIVGELTAFAEDALMEAYNEGCGAGVRSIILNFERLAFMSSSGIGLLVTLLIRAQRQEQRLLACGLNEHYRHIFELTRLNEAIAIYADEAQALAATRVAPG